MANRAMIPLLVVMMLLTGVCNTLLTKYQDMQCVRYCDTDHPKTFEQPVIQTLQMFIGESGCWLVVLAGYLVRRLRNRCLDYTPVAGASGEDDELVDDEDEEDDMGEAMTGSQTLVDATNVFAKPLIDGEDNITQRKPLTGWKVCILALPAICDICGTTLMNAGLLLVAASIYQMTRGALVLFVGLFSVIFLKHHLSGWKWASLFIVVTGVAVVGLAGALEQKPDLPDDTTGNILAHQALRVARDAISAMEAHTAAETLIGIFMIAGGQVFTATQFVVEESIMEKYSMDPIQVVGWEGVFGFVVTLIGIGVLHGAVGNTSAGHGGLFDAREGFNQVFHNRAIAVTSVLIMISIGQVFTLPLLSGRLANYSTAASTSSASVSQESSPLPPAARSTPAAPSLSGSFPWVSAGSHSNGCRSLVLLCSYTARRFSTRLFDPRHSHSCAGAGIESS